MARTNGNLDQRNRNGSNPDSFPDVTDIQEETQAGVENLKRSTIDSSLTTASTKSDLTIEQTGLQYERDIHTLVGFLSVLDNLLEEVKDTRKGLSKKGLSKAGQKTIDEAKTKLKQYEKQLKGKKKTILKQASREITDNEIGELRKLWQNLNEVRNDIGMGQWGYFSSTASYLYNSPETARKSNKHQADNLEFNQNFQEELKEGAILNIFDRNTKKANEFYRRIAQGEYSQADYQLFITNASVLAPSFQRCGIAIPTAPNLKQRTGGHERTSRDVHTSSDYRNMDWGDTLQQGGVAGVLDKLLSNFNNLTPGQRDTRKSLGVLTCVAGGIYGLYKFYTSKNMGFWAKAGITAGTIFGTEALLGETPLSLFNKLMTGGLSWNEIKNKFGNAVSGLGFSSHEASNGTGGVGQSSGETISETTVSSMYSMMIFNSSTKKSDIDKMTQIFMNDKSNKSRKAFYEESCNKLKKDYGLQATEYFQATFSDQFDAEKRERRLASFGVSEATPQNESIYGLANNAAMNEIILEKFITENGLIVTDKTALNNYKQNKKTSNQPIDVDDLNNHINNDGTGRFKVDVKKTHTDRQEDITNRENLVNKVESLSLDTYQKEKLKQAIQDFYDERSIESKPKLSDFNLTMDGKFVVLTSHGGYKSTIDIDKNEIVGFGNDLRFSNLSDLLNAADLSNKILEIQKGKTPKSLPPFEYKIGKKGRGIYFNDADFLSFNFDTRVLSGGRGGKMGEIETLSDHPKEYADYLSKRWIEENKININSTFYPIVKALSDTGIDFFNEQEVKDLEAWLKSIKEGQKFSVGTSNGNPYRISRRFTSLSNKLVFTAVNGDDIVFQEDLSSKFPTIMQKDNQPKFESFMNNKNNGMRGTVFN